MTLYLTSVVTVIILFSQLWRPQLIKDIHGLERIQRRATKYIPNNYDLSYKQRLEQLHILPLMYTYELNDLMFLIKTLKFPSAHFDISKYIQFAEYKSNFHTQLCHHRATSSSYHNSYFNRIIRLWNLMPACN